MSRSRGAISFPGASSGSSLIESALSLPFLVMLAFNAINFGYFYYVALNLASAPREGVEYSIQGHASPSSQALPAAGPCPSTAPPSVSTLTYYDINGVVQGISPCVGASVQVCSLSIGLNNAGTSTQTAKCLSYGPAATFPLPASDPESPTYVLHRVDMTYTVTPLLPVFPFKLIMPSSLAFHRQVSMRALN
jgi:TadE-like protein